jgi:RNA polymerase sigma factor (sigma-70 family)
MREVPLGAKAAIQAISKGGRRLFATSRPGFAKRTENTNEATTGSLFRRAQSGDRGARSVLVARALPWLAAWAHGRLPAVARAAADTADIVQEAATRVLRKLDGFEPRHRRALRAYLQQAVRNQIVDEIRRSLVRGPAVSIEEVELVSSDDPHARAAAAETYAAYRAALCRLKPEDQQVIVARLQNGLHFDQIALLIGRRSADSARMAFNRALERLLEAMKRL